jgi:hypothetical protein
VISSLVSLFFPCCTLYSRFAAPFSFLISTTDTTYTVGTSGDCVNTIASFVMRKVHPTHQRCGLLMAAVSFFSFVGEARGFRNFASDCSAGTDALLQPNQIVDLQTHAVLAQLGGVDLSEFGLKLELNGMALDVNTPTDFDVRSDHMLSLVAEGAFYAGFFIRLEATGSAETFGALQPLDDSVQHVSSCEDPGHAGVSHTENSRKQQTNMTLSMDMASAGLILDVTVVIETSVARNISHWYYSRFMLNSVIPEGQPTDSPTTLTPTKAPVADVPSETPTVMPTEATESPSEMVDDSSGYSLLGRAAQISSLLYCLSLWLL